MSDKQYFCPYCGDEIFIQIWAPGGKEPKGATVINHYCESGLSIEFFEHGQDREKAEKALDIIVVHEERAILELRHIITRLIGDNISCPKCSTSFIPNGRSYREAISILNENTILNLQSK